MSPRADRPGPPTGVPWQGAPPVDVAQALAADPYFGSLVRGLGLTVGVVVGFRGASAWRPCLAAVVGPAWHPDPVAAQTKQKNQAAGPAAAAAVAALFEVHAPLPVPASALEAAVPPPPPAPLAAPLPQGALQPPTAAPMLTAVDAAAAPMSVNPKQYARILKRREARARAEAARRLLVQRRPYMHESRHAHAARRPRVGGKFVSKAALAAAAAAAVAAAGGG